MAVFYSKGQLKAHLHRQFTRDRCSI